MRRKIVRAVVYLLGICLVLVDASLSVAAQPAKSNPTHNRLLKLTDAEKLAVFEIWAKNEGCGRVTKTFFQGQASDGTAIWNIRCSRAEDLSVSISPDKNGSTRVLECSIMKAVAKTDCFVKF